MAKEVAPPEIDVPSERTMLLRALAGDRDQIARLIGLVSPVIQARVARVLWRHRRASNPSRDDVLDLTQDVLASLFANDGRVLRAWEVERGLSLKNFVGLVADRKALSSLRRKGDEPAALLETVETDGPGSSRDERALLSRDVLSKLSARFRQELSPLGWELFQRLFVDEQSVAEIESECGLSSTAIYQWRSRLKKIAQRTLRAVQEASATPEVPREISEARDGQ